MVKTQSGKGKEHDCWITRFLKSYKVDPRTGCWLWNGYLTPESYGEFNFNGYNWIAHRLSYVLFIGDLPKELMVCHVCDTHACVNPSHLFVGTNKDNLRDALRKGRLFKSRAESGKRLDAKRVTEIKALLMEGELTKTEIARIYGMSSTLIGEISRGKRWPSIENPEPLNPAARKDTKLTEQQVLEIKEMLRDNQLTLADIARIYGIGYTMILNIKSGKNWKHVILKDEENQDDGHQTGDEPAGMGGEENQGTGSGPEV